MNFLTKIKRKFNTLYRRYILKEKFLIEAYRWFKDKGDETLRLNYPLNSDSIVFDIGGYHGDFAAAIYDKYKCNIYIFEPVPEFFKICSERFADNMKIRCLNFGLSNHDGFMNIGLAENASSFSSPHVQGPALKVELRSAATYIHTLNINQIDLMKINIEGGEFEVIPSVIASGHIAKIKNLQIQFHNFIGNAEKKRNIIRNNLASTHDEMWNYEFIWESWRLKNFN